MISLILTLFISVFSIGSANNRLVDHKENTIDSSISCKVNYALDYNDANYLFSFYEIINTSNFNNYYKENKTWWNTLDQHTIGDYIMYGAPNRSTAYLCSNYSSIDFDNLGLPDSDYYQFSYLYIVYNGYSVFYNDTINEEYVYQANLSLYFYDNNAQPVINTHLDFYYLYSNSLGGQFFTYASNYGAFNNYCVMVYTYDGADYWYNLFSTDNIYYDGYSDGYNTGYNNGYNNGERTGYQVGYQEALDDFAGNNSAANAIITGIFDIGLLPVNVFLTIFNFELFGINIAGIISGIMTLSVVIIILRLLLGGKDNDK